MKTDGEARKPINHKHKTDRATGSGSSQRSYYRHNPPQGPRRKFGLYNFAYFPHERDAFHQLFRLAEPENWDSQDIPNCHEKHLLLRSFVEGTFEKLKADNEAEPGKYICVSPGSKEMGLKKHAAFNTGLVDKTGNDIYALFSPNSENSQEKKPRQQWIFRAFCSNDEIGGASAPDSDFSVVKALFAPLPPRANYFKQLDEAIYDYRRKVDFNKFHIIQERLYRFPLSYLREKFKGDKERMKILEEAESLDWQSDEFVSKMGEITDLNRSPIFGDIVIDIEEAIMRARRDARENYMTVIPSTHAAKGGKMGHMLPLYLEGSTDLPSVIMLVYPDAKNPNSYYFGTTILTPLQAYYDARFIFKPSTSWLADVNSKLSDGKPYEPAVENLRQSSSNIPTQIRHEEPRGKERAFLVGDEIDICLYPGDTIGCRRDPERPFPTHSLAMSGNNADGEVHHISQIQGKFTFEDDCWYFTDSSTNGTIINRQTDEGRNVINLKRNQPFALMDKDDITFADFKPLTFLITEVFKGGDLSITPPIYGNGLDSTPPMKDAETRDDNTEPCASTKNLCSSPRLVNERISADYTVLDGCTVGVIRRPNEALPDIKLSYRIEGFSAVSQIHGRFQSTDDGWRFTNTGKYGTTILRTGREPLYLENEGSALLKHNDALSFADGPALVFKLFDDEENMNSNMTARAKLQGHQFQCTIRDEDTIGRMGASVEIPPSAIPQDVIDDVQGKFNTKIDDRGNRKWFYTNMGRNGCSILEAPYSEEPKKLENGKRYILKSNMRIVFKDGSYLSFYTD